MARMFILQQQAVRINGTGVLGRSVSYPADLNSIFDSNEQPCVCLGAYHPFAPLVILKWRVCSSHTSRSFYPSTSAAHPVSALILHPKEIHALLRSQIHDTAEKLVLYVVMR